MADGEAPVLRKRQQIQNVGKNMFIWVAVAAAIFGICVVLAVSLFERITYRQAVINAKNETASTLKDNITVADGLKDEVRVLNTNQALLDTPRLDDSEPVSVILDALPSTANSSALGASLQQKLLNIDGLTIESLIVDPIPGVEDTTDDGSSSVEGEGGENEITFQFNVSVASGQANILQNMLRRLEKSIRTINLSSVTIEQQGSRLILNATGSAYYQPAKEVEVSEKTVPKGAR